MVTMKKVNRQILRWHLRAFPDATEFGQYLKFFEEVWEWVRSRGSMEELADVYIVSAGLSERYGVCWAGALCRKLYNKEGLLKAVAYKMLCNVERTWTKKGRVYRHVETDR